MSDQATEQTTEIWLYAGTRVTSKGDRSQAWIPLPLPTGENVSTRPTDHELWYPVSKGQSFAVGSEYEVTVGRRKNDKDELVTTRYGVPTYHGRHQDNELRATVETVHRAHEARLRLHQLERSDKRSSALDEALEPLLAIAKNVPAPDREALMNYIQRKIYTSW